MTQIVVALSALIISVVLFASGNAFVNSLLGVRMSLSGIEPMTIGIVLFFFALGFVIGSRICPGIIQRVGHIRAFAVFSAAAAIAALVYPMSESMWLWGVMRFASGVAAAGLIITVESWFSCVATAGNRARLVEFLEAHRDVDLGEFRPPHMKLARLPIQPHDHYGAIDVVAEIPLLGAAHRKGYHN